MEGFKEKTLSVLNDRLDIINKKLKRIETPCCIDACNSIVLNKERMLTLTTVEHIVTYEFSPIYPTYFTPEQARKLQKEFDISDCYGNKIELVVVGAKEYYLLLKEETMRYLDTVKRLFGEKL